MDNKGGEESSSPKGKPPLDYVPTGQKQMLFGGSLLGCQTAVPRKVVMNPLFVDDTDPSNDEMVSREKHVPLRLETKTPKKDKDHYVTVFTISNGEVTFQRRGSQRWFSDGASSTDCPASGHPDDVVCHDNQSYSSSSLSSSSPQLVSQYSNSPDRKLTSSTSISPDQKLIVLPSCSYDSEDPARKYHKEAILKKKSRGGKKTDYGFIDRDTSRDDHDRISLNSADMPPCSALTDDEKVAQRCNGSLLGRNSPKLIVHRPPTKCSKSHSWFSSNKSKGKTGKAKKKGRKPSQTSKNIRKDVCEYRKVKACRLLGLTISMLIVVGLAVALVIYFARKDMVI